MTEVHLKYQILQESSYVNIVLHQTSNELDHLGKPAILAKCDTEFLPSRAFFEVIAKEEDLSLKA